MAPPTGDGGGDEAADQENDDGEHGGDDFLQLLGHRAGRQDIPHNGLHLRNGKRAAPSWSACRF